MHLLKRRQVLLSASLLVLVVDLAVEPTSGAGRFLFLAHLGLFLLWQPVVRPDYRLAGRDLLVLAGVLGAMLFAMSPSLLAAWVMVLISVVGGRSFTSSSAPARAPYLIALSLLILVQVLILMPAALGVESEFMGVLAAPIQVGLPLIALAIGFFPVEPDFDPQALGGIDLLSALLLFLVLAAILLGTLVLMQAHALEYFLSLALALTGTAGGMLLLAWVWNPRLGHAGLGAQILRHLLSTGLSFESWLHELASTAVSDADPDEFLAGALRQFVRIPGIVGVRWRSEVSGAAGDLGREGVAERRFAHGGLVVDLVFSARPGESLQWHYDLMLLVLAIFYREKCQTRELQLRSFEEAVHETGARLTHDVKNLLQILNALCFAASAPEADGAALQRLVRGQLPRIAARLESTLEKLRQPEDWTLTRRPVADWWREARDRHEGQRIRFVCDPAQSAGRIPGELYDTCLDNLLQNAIGKRQLQPDIDISVTLDAGAVLRVADSGTAIDQSLARTLLKQPQRSTRGLGMGLYQAARLAERAGYCLELVRNESGSVIVELRPAGSSGEAGAVE